MRSAEPRHALVPVVARDVQELVRRVLDRLPPPPDARDRCCTRRCRRRNRGSGCRRRPRPRRRAPVRHHERIVARVRGRARPAVARQHARGPWVPGSSVCDVRIGHDGLLGITRRSGRGCARRAVRPRSCCYAGRAALQVARLVGAGKRSSASATASGQPTAARARINRDAWIERGQRSARRDSACGVQDAEVGDHRARPAPEQPRAHARRRRRGSRRWCGNRAARTQAARRSPSCITSVCRACAAISGAPPAPGSRTRRLVRSSPITVLLRLPWRSICAAPRKPTSTRPRLQVVARRPPAASTTQAARSRRARRRRSTAAAPSGRVPDRCPIRRSARCRARA